MQGKVPKEIHASLTETLACFLPGRAKDLSSPLYIGYEFYPWRLSGGYGSSLPKQRLKLISEQSLCDLLKHGGENLTDICL